MRLSTERDKQVILENTQDGALGFLEFLPMLGERQAIIFGQGTPMPMRVCFKEFDDAKLTQISNQALLPVWEEEKITREELEDVVSRWRKDGRQRKEYADRHG